jgi:hypothetical protein
VYFDSLTIYRLFQNGSQALMPFQDGMAVCFAYVLSFGSGPAKKEK